MKRLAIFALIAFVIAVQSAGAAAITRADIIKTVEHLQQRCREAEAAQTAALKNAAMLQERIEAQSSELARQTDRATRLEAAEKAARAECARLRWSLLKWGSAALLLILALLGWIFRKPIAALCGLPIL